jgi:signal transduction histidine kinase
MSGPGGAATRTLRGRLRLMFAGAAVLVLIGLVATVVSLTRLDHATDKLVDRYSPARVAAAALATSYLNQETGLRGYALSRTQDFLAPYRTGREEAVATAARLRELMAADPAVLSALDDVTRAGEAWQRDFAEPSIKIVAAASPADRVNLDEAKGKARFDGVRAASATLESTIMRGREAARAALRTGILRLQVLLGLAIAAAIAAGVVIWVALRRAVTAPLDHLAAETRLVAAGDFRRRVAVGGPVEIQVLARDVEAMRRRIVAALEESEEAREELRAQTEILASQADDLRRSNDELEQFAYVASHDLQEPLRKVASFCQMLDRRYSGQLDERADQYIAFAVDGAKRMQLLINDLLTFSRVGRTSAGMVDVDTRELANRALDTLEEVRLEAEAEVEVGPLPVVHGDASLLTQLFQNLLGNAMKFRAPGRPSRVRLAAELEDDEWHFRCEDNGIGVEPQYAERVFVIFQRLHSKDQYDGTGIGLALCKKIVEYHGGRIWLDTDRQEGSAIHWTLPVSSEPDPEPEAASEFDAEPRKAVPA